MKMRVIEKIRETEKAILLKVRISIIDKDVVWWFPKLECEYNEEMRKIEVPLWLYNEKMEKEWMNDAEIDEDDETDLWI